MSVKICRYCEQEFLASQYHPNQDVCSSTECQRRRRTDYHRRKREEDPIYREQCRDSQRKWREQNPDYMKKYLASRREAAPTDMESSSLAGELKHLLALVKNNFALDLKSLTSAIWLVCPSEPRHAKNILAHAKLLAVEGTVYAFCEHSPVKNISLKTQKNTTKNMQI